MSRHLAADVLARRVRMIRCGAWKFVHSPADPDQLFKLDRVPDELVNPADTLAAFRSETEQRWDLAAIDRPVRERLRRRLVNRP